MKDFILLPPNKTMGNICLEKYYDWRKEEIDIALKAFRSREPVNLYLLSYMLASDDWIVSGKSDLLFAVIGMTNMDYDDEDVENDHYWIKVEKNFLCMTDRLRQHLLYLRGDTK